jgi:hypothetical protein
MKRERGRDSRELGKQTDFSDLHGLKVDAASSDNCDPEANVTTFSHWASLKLREVRTVTDAGITIVFTPRPHRNTLFIEMHDRRSHNSSARQVNWTDRPVR